MGLSDFKNAIVTEDKFSGTFRKFDTAVGGSARGLDKLGGVLSSGSLGMLFGATAGVAGAIGVAKTVWSLGELGAKSLTTKASFESLMQSVGQSPALLTQMTQAAGGTITQMQLMQQANTALAGTSGQLATELAGAIPQLIEAGRAAAMLNPAMGDAAFMTQSLITGIKRGSPMLIDNTGITLKLGEATEAYAQSVGKSVSELTAQERSIAILRATLASSGTLIEQVGGSLDSMTSDIQGAGVAASEAKTAFAELFAPVVVAGAKTLTGIFKELNQVLSSTELTRSQAMLVGYREELERLNNIPVSQRTTLDITDIEDTINSINRLTREMLKDEAVTMAAATAASIFNNQLAILASTEHQISDKARAAGAATATFDDRLAGLFATARGGSAAMQTLIGYINGVQSAAAGGGSFTGFLGGVDVLSSSQYVAITEQRINMERALNVQVAAGILTQLQADYQLQTFDNTVTNHLQTLRDQAKEIDDVGSAASSLGSTYDDLKSKISGALRPTFDLSGLTGGLLGGAGGDAFDEAYKRLAAVALRPEELQIHAQDWAGTFDKAGLTGLSPEDAQAEAKRLVEAYSKGLDFSLIDKEALKDSIRQGIKADELYQAMVDEIYLEMGKENPKLTQAGGAVGARIANGALIAIKNKSPDMVQALAYGVAPSVAKILAEQDARYKQ